MIKLLKKVLIIDADFYSGGVSNWRQKFHKLKFNINLPVKFEKLNIILTTHNTFSKEDFINYVNECEIKSLLIVDEMHHVGAEGFSKGLNAKYGKYAVLGEFDTIPTMIFDEIDTGISGRMAQAVAEKMIMISRRQQVICISHLPQIAAAADHHYLIYKGVKGGRTFTEASELTATEHINEVARMISGAQGITEDAKHYADLMIAASHETRK